MYDLRDIYIVPEEQFYLYTQNSGENTLEKRDVLNDLKYRKSL